MLLVYGHNFTCGAVFAFDPPIRVRAADKREVYIGRGVHKCIQSCGSQGWCYEVIKIEKQPSK